MTLTYNGYERDGKTPTYGGYSTRIIVDENYVLRIPEGIPLERAAPLLCAGITTYSPLKHFGARSRRQGRRGRPRRPRPYGRQVRPRARRRCHRAQPFARASARTRSKLGADDFIVTKDADAFIENAGRFDFILDTVSAQARLQLLSQPAASCDGIMVLVGVPDEPTPLQRRSLILKRQNARRLADRRHPRDPGDARFLRRARHRGGRRDDRRSTRSTRPTSACSRTTCAIASSSTSPP